MAEATSSTTTPGKPEAEKKTSASSSTFARVAKYTGVRIVTMAITVVIGLYLTILIANMGGYVDNIRKGQIREEQNSRAANDPAMRRLPLEERQRLVEERIRLAEQRLGLDRPFPVRSLEFLRNAIILDLGRAQNMTSSSGSTQVRLIILERLPPTLILFATADIFLFVMAILIALALSRQYGSWFDKFMVALTPLSSAPGWFYGIFFILLFASVLHWLPFGGMVDSPPPPTRIGYFLSLLEHMALPVLSITISQLFLNVFSWRTFFLIYSSEDYVDMARAKGLPDRDVNNRYILRPTLPTIITSFALLVIAMWLGAPILETIFNWPGLGRALYQAVTAFDTPVIIGSTVIFSYMLAVTVFLLDIVYALVDPRVKIGDEGSR